LPAATPDLSRRHLPLYLGLYGLGASALMALTSSVNAPAFGWLLHLAYLTGCFLSYRGAVSRRLYLIPGVFFLVAGFTAYGLRQTPAPAILLMYPLEILAQNDLALAALVGWFLVGFSFWQGSRPNLIFCVVCGLALFGLVGTINLNTQTWLHFCAYLLCTAFCWGYEQFLEVDDSLAASGQPRHGDWREMVRGHLAVAALLCLVTLGAGRAIGSGIFRLTPNLYSHMAEQVYGWDFARRLNWTYSTFAEEFRIGTGPTELSNVPVMTVTANRPALWRGAVYDFYDGRGWSRARRENRVLVQDGARYRVPDGFLPSGRAGLELRQHYSLLAFAGQLLAAAHPRELTIANPPPSPPMPFGFARGPTGALVDQYGCLSWGGGAAGGALSYSVVSREPPREPEVLRRAAAEYPEWLNETGYLRVPAATALALRSLVRDLTAGRPTVYDKVAALQDYLERRCVYSLRAPAVPVGQDVVAHFVLRSHRGACDQFASALVIMCRLADIPARVATGYATGEEDTKPGTYMVRGKDAHAWAEVLFTDIGWVPFSPEAVGQEGELSWTELLLTAHWDLAVRQASRVIGWGLLAAAVLVLALSAVLDPLALLRRLRRRSDRSPLGDLAREYQTTYTRALQRRGMQSLTALTPAEAAAALTGDMADSSAKDALRRLNEGFYGQRYGLEVDDEEVERLRHDLRALRRQLRRRR
jgi:hypothetical protein